MSCLRFRHENINNSRFNSLPLHCNIDVDTTVRSRYSVWELCVAFVFNNSISLMCVSVSLDNLMSSFLSFTHRFFVHNFSFTRTMYVPISLEIRARNV